MSHSKNKQIFFAHTTQIEAKKPISSEPKPFLKSIEIKKRKMTFQQIVIIQQEHKTIFDTEKLSFTQLSIQKKADNQSDFQTKSEKLE